MYNLDIYNTKLENNNMVYSIDKIRLKTYINYVQFKNLEDYINIFHKDKIKRFWLSDKKNSFHYNYNIEVEEGKSFIFQYIHNTENINYNRDNIEYNFTIEFNPNKLKDNKLILYILNSYSFWFIRSYDLAIDIPINILDILIDKKMKRCYKCFSQGGDNITYYLGSKDKDGSIKIYNKKKESNLDIVGFLTRVEISRKCEDFPICDINMYNFGVDNLPKLFLNEYCFSFTEFNNSDKDKTILALLFAVQHGYSLNNLSRKYREKIEDMLKGGSAIVFNEKIATQTLLKCLFYYFVRKESKQVIL